MISLSDQMRYADMTSMDAADSTGRPPTVCGSVDDDTSPGTIRFRVEFELSVGEAPFSEACEWMPFHRPFIEV